MNSSTISPAGTYAHLEPSSSGTARFWRIRPTYIGWRTHLYGPELTTRWPRSLWMRTVVSRNGFTAGLRIKSLCADLATFHKPRKRPKGEIETFAGKTLQPADYEEVAIDTDRKSVV